MKRSLALLGALSVSGVACDEEHAELAAPPAIVLGALDISAETFSVSGAVKVATCDGGGALTYRKVNSRLMEARGRGADTCAFLSGAEYTACVAGFSPPPTATTSILIGTTAAGDESYLSTPPQFIKDPRDLTGATLVPIVYGLSYPESLISGPMVRYQNSTRYLHFARPITPWVFTAPSDTGATYDLPIVRENLASYRLDLRYTPVLRDSFGVLDPNDRIVSLSYTVYLQDLPSNPTLQMVHRFEYDCPLTENPPGVFHRVCTNSAANVDIDLAAAQNGFLNIPAVDGQTVTPQRIIAELPITPNATGDFAGATYYLRVNAIFDDGVNATLTDLALSQPTVAPCDEVTQVVTLSRPPSEIRGSIVLERDPLYPESPYATAYAPTVYVEATGTFAPVDLGNDPIYTAVADAATTIPEVPHAFRWLGLPAGDYRVQAPSASTTYTSRLFGHLKLAFPGRPALDYPSATSDAYPAMFRFPMRDSSTPDETFTLTVADANGDGAADLPVDLTIAGQMAYLEGSLTLAGCVSPLDYTAGAAELQGAASRGVDRLSRGFARGLFLPGTSGYQVAAIAGDWVENRYLLKLDTAAERRLMFIEPATKSNYTLATGWANKATAPSRAYATTLITMTMSLTEGGAQVDTRNPILEINQEADGGLGSFRDPVTNELLGKYYSRSGKSDDQSALAHTLTAIALSSNASAPVTIRASVEKVVGASTIRVNLPAFDLDLAGVSGDGCTQVCIDSTGEQPVIYTDDGAGPLVSGTTSIMIAPFGSTSVTLTGTLTDQVPITEVQINGVSYPVTSTSNGQNPPTFTAPFSVEVELAGAMTVFDIVGKGLCGSLGASTRVRVRLEDEQPPDLCADATYEMCLETATGSIFYVDVVSPDNEHCKVRCETVAAGAQLTCDTNPICGQ